MSSSSPVIKTVSEDLFTFDDDGKEIVAFGDNFYKVPKFNTKGSNGSISHIRDNGELNAFFRKLIKEAAQVAKIPVESLEQDWLSQLLTRFCSRKEFLDALNADSIAEGRDEKDEMQFKYLAEMVAIARQTQESTRRALRYLRIGDQALFTAGFFPERISKQLGDDGVDYYLEMSRTGYGNAAVVLKESFIRHIANKVGALRKIIRCVCTATKHDENRMPFVQLMKECGQAEPIMVN